MSGKSGGLAGEVTVRTPRRHISHWCLTPGHLRLAGRFAATLAELRSERFALFAREAARHDLRHAVVTHGDPVQDIRRFHRALLMGDDDELRAICVAPQEL